MPNTSPRTRSTVSSAPLPRKKKRRRMRRHLGLNRRLTNWEWAGLVASFFVSVFLVRSIALAEIDQSRIQEQLEENRVQWAALERQRQEEEQRLSFLKSDEGRGQLLAERGYLRPGDRILLFPSEEDAAEAENKNEEESVSGSESKKSETDKPTDESEE